MEAVAVADVVHEASQASEDVALAAQCAATTLLTTALSAAEVETLARRIHAASARAAFPFVRVAAATLPGDAARLTQTCTDLLAAASGGSLLLTDVEHMPAIAQDQLIETVTRLQATREPSCRVRLIAGTTTSLCERVADGTFSEHLFYQLNIIHVVARNRAGHSSSAGGAA